MPFESYQPSKESREIDRAQREHVAGEEVRLGFARSHTETAKPMDTLRGMIKRAYKEGKLYSEKQASEAAGEVVQRLEAAGAKMRVSPGDRITFRNDSVTLSRFDQKEGGFVDTKIDLTEGEGSVSHRKREIVGSAQVARADLSEELEETREKGKRPENPAEYWEGKEPWEVRLEREAIRRARAEQGKDRSTANPSKVLEIPDQRREALRTFIRNGEELRRVIRSEKEKEDESKLQIHSFTRPFSVVPTQFKDYEFNEVIAQREGGQENYMIGLRPQTGEVVVFNTKNLEKATMLKIKDFSDLRQLKLALALLANPSIIDLKPGPNKKKE